MRNLCARVRGPRSFVESILLSFVLFLYFPANPTSFIHFRFHRTLSNFHSLISPAVASLIPSSRSLSSFNFFPSHLPYRFPFRLSISIPYTSVSHFLSFAQLPLLSRLLLHYFLYTQHTISCTRCAGAHIIRIFQLLYLPKMTKNSKNGKKLIKFLKA